MMTTRVFLLLASVQLMVLIGSGHDLDLKPGITTNLIEKGINTPYSLRCMTVAVQFRSFYRRVIDACSKTIRSLRKPKDMAALKVSPCFRPYLNATSNNRAVRFAFHKCNMTVPKPTEKDCYDIGVEGLRRYSQTLIPEIETTLNQKYKELSDCFTEHPVPESVKKLLPSIKSAHLDFMITVKEELKKINEAFIENAKPIRS